MIQKKFVLFMRVVIIRSGNETNEIIDRLIKSFLSNYQEEEKILRSGSNFVFDSVNLLFVNIH